MRGGEVMIKAVTGILGLIVLAMGLTGLVSGEGTLAGLTNIDISFDIVRVIFGAVLVYFGFFQKSEDAARGALGTVGAIYILMGLLAIVDSTMFGLIPSGLTVMDAFFHIVSGIIALSVAWVAKPEGARSEVTART